MKVILDAKQIADSVENLTGLITEKAVSEAEVAFVGLMSRCEVLAQRLCQKFTEQTGKDAHCGALDITLYRDDLNDPHGNGQPTVRATEIDFDISGKTIVLVDDVLYTGRSVRAAMDALIALGRPKAVLLAVLVDRGHRELPIQADFQGTKVDVEQSQTVEVMFLETDEKDQVTVS